LYCKQLACLEFVRRHRGEDQQRWSGTGGATITAASGQASGSTSLTVNPASFLLTGSMSVARQLLLRG